jgi:hypothetical protein
MVESAEDRSHLDTPVALNGPSIQRILFQREVRTHRIVKFQVARKDVAKVLLACHHNVVETFPTDRTDQALCIPVLPWRACRCGMIANAKRANPADEDTAVSSVPIAEQIARNLLPAAGGRQLIGNPFRGGVSCHAEPQDVPPAVAHDQQPIQ